MTCRKVFMLGSRVGYQGALNMRVPRSASSFDVSSSSRVRKRRLSWRISLRQRAEMGKTGRVL
jgi:hypothetical protein